MKNAYYFDDDHLFLYFFSIWGLFESQIALRSFQVYQNMCLIQSRDLGDFILCVCVMQVRESDCVSEL